MSVKKSNKTKDLKFSMRRVRVMKNFPKLAENDPVLLRKEKEFLESLKEAPLPETILKKIESNSSRYRSRVPVAKDFPYVDKNDPVLIRKKEEAIKSLKEAPLPEHISKRIQKPD